MCHNMKCIKYHYAGVLSQLRLSSLTFHTTSIAEVSGENATAGSGAAEDVTL